MCKILETLATTDFRLTGTLAGRGLAVYRRRNAAGLEVISIHRVYNAGETNNPAFDGWSNHSSLEEARTAWKATRDLWISRGWEILEAQTKRAA